MNRNVILAITIVALVGFALLWYDYLLFYPIQEAVETVGGTVDDFIQWHEAEFRKEFHDGVQRSLSPRFAIRVAPGTAFLQVIVFGAVLWFSIWSYQRQSTQRWVAIPFLVCAIPIYLGILAQALVVKHSFRALAAAGITSPPAIGVGIGESFSALFLGIIFSAVSLAAVFFVYRKSAKRGLISTDDRGQ